MKKMLLITFLSLIIFACSKQSKFKMINQCQNNIYYIVDGNEYTLYGNSSRKHDVDMDTGLPFTAPEKKINLTIWGDTFYLYDEYAPGDSLSFFGPQTTNITVIHDEELKLYFNPNRACVEITNISNFTIDNIEVQKTNMNNLAFIPYDNLISTPIAPNETSIITLFANPRVETDNGIELFPYHFYAYSNNICIDSLVTTTTNAPIILDYDEKFLWNIDGE